MTEQSLPTCRELIEFLDDYVADRLPAPRRDAFEAHLALCPDCRTYLGGYRRTIEVAGGLRDADDAAPPPMPEELIRAILAVAKPGNRAGPAERAE